MGFHCYQLSGRDDGILRTFKYVMVPLKVNHKSTKFFTGSNDPGDIRTCEGKNQEDGEKGKSDVKLSSPTLSVL